MIASSVARDAFAQWPSATRILVYDADLSQLADGSGVLGLLRKFEAAGFTGELAWLVGGHNAVARLARDCLEAGGIPSESDNPPAFAGAFVSAHSLPQSAFQQSSTITGPSHRPNQLQPSNPFYDNIRQNRELSHGITERIPLELSKEILSRKDEIPIPWIREIVENSDKEKGVEALAMQFYRIELGEQRRLQGVMSHHSKAPQTYDWNPISDHDPFPFSITAGVEKGAKNRYKNIWPYEHARVRLQSINEDDYVNASHVRPRGTNLHYIATQGPMAATFVDFWTMVWEQNVHVIVMLTRQVEGNQPKCANYWSEHQFGPLRLQLIATEGGKEEVESTTGFDFGFKKADEGAQPTIRRTFVLSHTEYPDEPPRKIVQFQFLSWLDMNVPETPDGLLELVKNVREAAEEGDKHSGAREPSPVLVHCSAGVGRTGSFVAIDAILDGVRRDLDAKRGSPPEPSSSDDPSDSDFDTSGDPSSDSLSGLRRASFPESERKGLGLSPARQRQISLRKKLGARRSTSSVPVVREGGRENGTVREHGMGRDGSNGMARIKGPNGAGPGGKVAGAVTAPGLNSETNTTGTISSSAVSFNFSDASIRVSATTAGMSAGNHKFVPVLGPSAFQTTHAWSSEVANNVSKSDLVAPQPVSVSTKFTTPRPDSEMANRERDTFDYVPPRSLSRGKPASPLASMDEPIREVLEDMREQRMSLVQSLRQYVFVHRAVVEGVLAMVDAEKERGKEAVATVGAKRHASPTELVKVNMAGDTARVKKRPSLRSLGKDANRDSMMVDS